MTKVLSSPKAAVMGPELCQVHGSRENAVSSSHKVLSLVQFGGWRQNLPGAKLVNCLLSDALGRRENWILF